MINNERNIADITYYPPKKTYAAVCPTLNNSGEPFELAQFQQSLGLTVDFSAAEVRSPVFYICRDRGILRFNRAVYSLVTIPAQLRQIAARSSNIEVVITSGGSPSFVSVFVPVERVLRFPDYLRELESSARKEKDKAAEEKDEKPRFDGMSGADRTPPRQIFESWLAGHGGELLQEYHGGGLDYVLAGLGGNLMLVSFFDDPESDWLADELEVLEPPQWVSDTSHRQSPLYAVGRAARNFSKMHRCEILPLAILSDHINIRNADCMADEWRKTGVEICYCSRSEDFAPPFAEYLALLSIFPEHAPPLDDLEEIKAAIGDQLALLDKKESC